MLVIDEYNELEFLESLLRRLGFDVLSLNKDLSVPSAILGFFPDLVMAQVKSRAVDGVALSHKVRKLAPQARMVLLHPVGQPPKGPELKNTVDAFLDMPVDPSKLIAMLAQLGSLDEKILQDKLNRMAAGKMSEEKRVRLQGSAPQGAATQSIPSSDSGMVHVTSRNPVAGQGARPVTGGGGGMREAIDSTIISGGNSQPIASGIKANASSSESVTGDAFSKGVHHFQGTNTQKGPTHIAGVKQQEGAAYDPSGKQSAAPIVSASYVPTPASTESNSKVSGRRAAAVANAEVTERTKRYDQFLGSHDEPADKVIPQGEMKRQAKILKLDLISTETELAQKREFVRALFRK